jgi:hypothetical protein
MFEGNRDSVIMLVERNSPHATSDNKSMPSQYESCSMSISMGEHAATEMWCNLNDDKMLM